jgi:hypothetical protein
MRTSTGRRSQRSRLVFERQPFSKERRASLAAGLQDLAQRIKATSTNRFLELESLELRRLAEIAKGLPPEASLVPLQNDWMRIRNNLFEDRSWFARSVADLQAP